VFTTRFEDRHETVRSPLFIVSPYGEVLHNDGGTSNAERRALSGAGARYRELVTLYEFAHVIIW
jgi:hypothetical protein